MNLTVGTELVFPSASFEIGFGSWWWNYMRCANCASISIGFVRLVIPLPWLPQAAYQKGWDACWRELYTATCAPHRAISQGDVTMFDHKDFDRDFDRINKAFWFIWIFALAIILAGLALGGFVVYKLLAHFGIL